MTDAIDNGIWLKAQGGERIPVEFGLSSYEIRPSARGWHPQYIEIHYTYDDPEQGTGRFDGLENPITIIIKTHGRDGSPFELELKNWFVIQRYRYSEQTGVLLIADVRSQLLYTKLTRSYNIEIAGSDVDPSTGKVPLRQDSAFPGGRDFTGFEALQDALFHAAVQAGIDTLPGFDVVRDPKGMAGTTDLLPRNLSNNADGGFAGAPYSIWTQIMGEAVAFDIAPTPEGGLMIVDRVIDHTGFIDNYGPPIAGRYGKIDREPEQPGRVVIQFRKRVERTFSYAEQDPPQTTSGAIAPRDLSIENVIPVFAPSADPKDLTHAEIWSYIENITRPWSGTYKPDFRRRALLRRIEVPGMWAKQDINHQTWRRNITAGQTIILDFLIDNIPECVRRKFRVKKEELQQGGLNMPMVDLVLGRLNADGTTRVTGVYMDFTRLHRVGFYRPGEGPEAGGTPLDAKYSENVRFDQQNQLFNNTPSPFVARWVTEDPDDLIFEIMPQRPQRWHAGYLPGLLEDNLGHPTVQEVFDGEPPGVSEATLAMQPTFRMAVFYNGVQIAPFFTGSGLDPVMYEVGTDVLFPNGKAPTLYRMVDDMTANFRKTLTGNDWPGELTNRQALVDRANHEFDLVLQGYRENVHGMVQFSGVEPADKIRVGGNVNDVIIAVGKEDTFSINTWVRIASGMRYRELPREQLSGKQPRLIG